LAQLSDAMPLAQFKGMFSTVTEVVTARDRESYYASDPEGASRANLFVWEEAVSRGVVKDEGAEMRSRDPDDPAGAYALTRLRIGEEPFKDIFCAEYYNEHSEQIQFGREANFPFARISLVHCYPNDIHIAELALLDLAAPVQNDSEVPARSHEELGLFPILLEGLKKVAEARGVERLSHVPRSPAARRMFSEHGFEPTETDWQSKMEMLSFSHGVAMQITGDLTDNVRTTRAGPKSLR
jgi:hypothetical protein